MAEFKDRGSRFIAYAYPIASPADFKARLEEIKKEHPKATHHCFAYRLGITNDLFRVSDAGEPSGTAGKPILGQIIAYPWPDRQQTADKRAGGRGPLFRGNLIGRSRPDQRL